MEDYVEQIERFLRGQMNQEEESVFKTSLSTDAYLRSYVVIMAFILKAQKTG